MDALKRWLLRRYPWRHGLIWLTGRWFPDPPPDAGWVRSRHGLEYRVRSDRMYRLLYYAGTYEPDETAVLLRLTSPGQTVVDIGVNFGWYAVLLGSTVGPTGRVLGFEPLPEFHADACAAVERNGLSGNVTLRNAGLGDCEDDLVIYTFAGLPSGHASASRQGRDDAVAHTCRQEVLDDALAAASIDHVDVIKCDVEGHEPAVFRGAARTLAAPEAPLVVFEANPPLAEAAGYRWVHVFEQLRGYGYDRFHRIVKGGRLTAADGTAPVSGNYVASKAAHRDLPAFQSLLKS